MRAGEGERAEQQGANGEEEMDDDDGGERGQRHGGHLLGWSRCAQPPRRRPSSCDGSVATVPSTWVDHRQAIATWLISFHTGNEIMNAKLNFLAALLIGIASLAHAQSDSHFQVVPVESMPLNAPPGEVEKTPGGSPQFKDAKKYADFRHGLDIALSKSNDGTDAAQRTGRPQVVKDLSKLKITPFSPKKHSSNQRLLVASPAGLLTEDGWSGVERHISVPNVGVYKLTEFDLAKSGGKFFLASDAVNANIEDLPAATKEFVDDEGNIVEEAVWVTDGRFCMLTFVPDTEPGASPANKRKRVASVSAISLAQELAK